MNLIRIDLTLCDSVPTDDYDRDPLAFWQANHERRADEDFGVVTLPDKGDARANAIMKAITKAKRRATLSLCGLGMLDETEIETIPASAKQPPKLPARIQRNLDRLKLPAPIDELPGDLAPPPYDEIPEHAR